MAQADTADAATATPATHQRTYYAFVLLGFGLLLPFNFVLNSIPFFSLYFGPSIGYLIGVTFTTPQLLMQPIMLSTGQLTHPTSRLIGSSIAQATIMLCMPFLGIVSEGSNSVLMLLAGAATAIMECSLLGFASLLPSQYTQGVMVGEGIAGMLSSLAQLFVKFAFQDQPENVARAYFIMACVTMLSCGVAAYLLKQSPIVRLHVTETRGFEKPQGKEILREGNAEEIDVNSITIQPIEFATPGVQEDEQAAATKTTNSTAEFQTSRGGGGKVLHSGLQYAIQWFKNVKHVLKFTYMTALAIFLNFVATFLYLPGVAASIRFRGAPISSAEIAEDNGWWTVLIFLGFSVGDLIGRLAAAKTPRLKQVHILLYAVSRFVWVPLIVGFAREWSGFNNDVLAMIVVVLSSVTNGHCVSLAMMEAPLAVDASLRELAGFVQVLFLHSGISAGSVLALSLEQSD